jgi:hypothetical protein
MITWLTRSLAFIVVGAVLGFALTADHIKFDNDRVIIDVKAVGVILMLVGVFDLLLNFGMLMYMRQPVRPLNPYLAAHTSTQTTATHITEPVARPVAAPGAVDPHDTRVIGRDPNWH